MVTRRTDARRRRVLSEEFVPTDQAAVAENNKPMQAYSFGANRRNQPKTTDLIPKRTVALSLFFVLILSIVAVINALAWYRVPLVEILGEQGAASLAMSGPGTLANWFSSVCLLLCAGICLQLFLLRKHKRDDYGGMYRVWILMSVMFVFASIDCAIDLRTITAKLFEYLTLRSLLQTPWLLMTIELIVLGIVVIRMLFEVRASKFSLAAVLLVWIGFVGCIALQHVQVPESVTWLDQNIAYGNCILLGCGGSLVALTVYTRFVFLHAHGLIQLKVKEEATATEAEQPEDVTTKKTKSTRKAVQTAAKPEATTQPQTTKRTKVASKPKAASPLAQKQQQAKAAKASAAQQQKAAAQQKALAQQEVAAKQKEAAQQKAAAKEAAAKKAAAKKQAAAAQQKAKSEALVDDPFDDVETISMSKAERRRQRKLAKRAARAKKAA